MKGLRKLALSWLFFAWGASASATEIADNLLKLDPLVYFGAESFESDEVKGLNRGSSNSRLQHHFSGEQPSTQASFLGAHAGQALHMDGQASLTLPLDFLADADEASGAKVMSFSAAASEAGATRQCLLSIGQAMALVLEEGTFRIYTPGPDGPQVEFPDVSGLQENRPLTLVFTRNQIELSTGLTSVWKGDFPEGVAALTNDSLTLGNCSTQIKSELLKEEINGFQGHLDEWVILDAPALSWAEGQASVPAAQAMAKATLNLAAAGFYPIDAQPNNGSVYAFYELGGESFSIFVYPHPDEELGMEGAGLLCTESAGPCHPLDLTRVQSGAGISIMNFAAGFDFYRLSMFDKPKSLELTCFGDEESCRVFPNLTLLGKAFGKPKSLSAKPFGLVRTGLPASYERSVPQLSLPFSDALEAVDAGQQPVSEGLVTLYRSDEAGEQWTALPIAGLKASGNQLEINFQPRLTTGRYRLVLDAQLTSSAGVVLGTEQTYEFSVNAPELLITSATTISAVDMQHDGKRLVVDGATLTLAGVHDFESIVLKNTATLTSPTQQAIRLSADSIEVDATSFIDVSAKGKLGTTAIGTYTGGTHGGSGGIHSSPTNALYGDFREPKEFGSGGRNGSTGYTRGGGALELRAGLLKLEGRLQANGQQASSHGSGSGGSILLNVDALELGANAQVQANGGGVTSCGTCTYGGGGGGRVAIHYKQLDRAALVKSTQARGGFSWHYQQGAAGTVYLKDLRTAQAELIIDNTSLDKARTATSVLDLGATGELAEKLTVINANVRIIGAKLGELSLQDSAATLNLGEVSSLTLTNGTAQLNLNTVGVLRATNSVITQGKALTVSDLQLTGGSWNQAGSALNAESYKLVGSTLDMSGPFNGAAGADLLVDGFTLVLNQNGSWGKVRVINGGKITMPEALASATTGLSITADVIEVDATSFIDVSAKGKLGTTAIGTYTGGSYGGSGGIHSSPTNALYGDYREPKEFGSGGRNGSTGYTRGGGALELRAGLLKLEGRLQANGQQASSHGSGSGGSILLNVDALELGANAQVQANGGGVTSCGTCTYGGGGGGRIAVHYKQVDRAALLKSMQARGGLSWNCQLGAAGTLYLNDLSAAQAELVIDNTGVDKARAATSVLDLGATGELAEKLTVINANVRIIGAKLGELSLQDSAATLNLGEVSSLTLTNGTAQLNLNTVGVLRATNSTLTQGKALTVSDLQLTGGSWNQAGSALNAESYKLVGSTLDMSGPFNGEAGADLLVDGFTLVLNQSGSWSKVRVINGGKITTPEASASATTGLSITADVIEVDATSFIDVSAKGMPGISAIGNYTGGSHGGNGGIHSGATNAPYGDFREPKGFGSGGRDGGVGYTRGGGAIELHAGLLKLEGSLQANGQHASSRGSGSGGSILLNVDALELGANAQVQANGGGVTSCGTCTYGGGGGGRVAIHYKQLDRAALVKSTQARGGFSWHYQQGAAGTVYLKDLRTAQAELIIDNTSLDKARTATSVLDLGPMGELAEKLTVINANVRIIGAKLGEVSLKDSVASLKTGAVITLNTGNSVVSLNADTVTNLQASNSQLSQASDLQVSDLRLTGGSWNQAGFALNADSYKLGGSTLHLNGVFNQAINELVVDGYTAELSKSASWSKVQVINGGRITTPVASGTFSSGITLTADTIEVDATSFIDVSGKGSLPSPAVGNYCGGSHGGRGGSYAGCTTNPVYGEYLAPTGFGMGGRHSGTSTYDMRGGGALKLVSRSLTLNGQLLANGGASQNGFSVGGGAGGSLWVDTQLLFGSASTRIWAQGGNGRYSGGAGGGGRIAIYYAGLQGFDPISQINVAAGSGTGAAAGGVGSLHLENRVVSTAVADADVTGFINREVSAFTVDFINAVLPESVTAEQVQLSGPNGLVSITGISALNTVRYQFQLDGALADGAYELRVGPGIRSAQGRGMDQNGNGIEAEAQDVFVRPFVVDHLLPQAPVVNSPLVAPALNALTARKVSLSGTRESQTAILVNGVQQVVLGDGAWSIANHALVEGESELKVQARDKAGNLSAATVLRFSVDSLSPSFQQYSHNSNALKQAPASVWVRFSETGSGLDFANSSLTLKRAGAVISGQLTQGADLLSLTPGGTLLEGAYTVEVRLQDKVGNLRTTSFGFTLDYTPPTAPLLNAYPAVTVNKLLPIAGSKEAGSTLRVRNAANAPLTSICCNANTWQYSLTLEPGDNLFSLDQTDAAGNVSPRTELRVRFDNEAPGQVTFVIDPKGSGTELNLAWPAYDEAANGNDIQQYRVYSAAQPFTQVASAQLLMSVPGGTRKALVKNLARGEPRYFAVVAVDQQGLLLDQIASQAATPQDTQAPEDPLGLSVVSLAERLDLAWQASPNKAGDLAGYALYVGASDPQRIDLPLSALTAGLTYSLADLDAASANPLRLVAVDGDGNESAGQRNAGITLLGNPQGLQLQAFANRFEATWSAVQPGAWVSGYRLYVADAPFTSVQGMTPKLISGAAQTSASVAGLLNDKTYHVAVSVVNASGGENPQVQSVSVKPLADGQGPTLTQLSWNAAAGATDLRGGGELTQLGEFRLQATDESGIGRVELSLNGQPLGLASQAGGYYRYTWDLIPVADGDYQLGVKLYDTLDNFSETQIELAVDLAAPGKPSLSLQSKAAQTNTPQQMLVVQGPAHTLAQVLFNGDEAGSLATLDGNGQALLPLTLVEGENQISARLRYSSRDRFGEASAPLSVTLDSALPNAPANLQAVSRTLGVVQLSWSAVSNVAAYNLYVAAQPFTGTTDTGVSKVTGKAIAALTYQHKPSEDGTYYYRVSSLNALGSESALSGLQSAVADRSLPVVQEALYSTQVAVASDGRYAPGRVEVRLRMSEPLRNAPFFSLDVPEGVSIPVRMSQAANDPLFYQGSFDISTAVPSGLLYARVSAHDKVGNEGGEILEGKTLRVDTQGPDVQLLSLLPEHPVENIANAGQGRELQVVLRLSDDPLEPPHLTPQLNGQALASQPGPISLTKEAQSQPGAPVYSGRFRLPLEAGQAQVDLLGFQYRAVDDLGNRSQRIQGRRDFQVYQGDLPPLDSPLILSGKALAGGRVALQWRGVTDASSYQLYRRGAQDSAAIPFIRVRELSFEDNLPAAGLGDGRYAYQVASIREHEGKEVLSPPSAAVEVQVLSQPSSAPRDLAVELNGAGLVLRWQAPAEAGTFTYNLYRANVGQGQALDIAGRTPLQSAIPALLALDSRPSDSEHAYTVTAMDAAGNESAAAASVYLNAGLLPVRDLSIRLDEGQPPRLQWGHSGKDVLGYNLYLGPAGARQKLNGQPIGDKFYVDQGVALPLTDERLYSVTAVDAQGVESLPHSLALPALKAELRADQLFQRGLFNQLNYRVSNSGTQGLTRLQLRVKVEVAGQVKQHLSEFFDVAAGGLSDVSLVVAGYQDLPGVVPLSAELLHAPQVGEEVVIQRSESISAGENTLQVQLLADEFTRGGSGSVRLRLENPSAVVTELVTASGNGSQGSTEMRLILEDLQGNVLASEPVKAAIGNGLVTVRDGRTVARVGALEVLETGPFSIKVPTAAPDQVRVRLEADFLHHQTGLPTELKIGGLRGSRELTLVETPYYGELVEIVPQQVQAGDKLLIKGRALTRGDAQPLANADLTLVLAVRGFEQVLSVTTDAQGLFQYQHASAAGDSGDYQVSVIHPSLQARPQQGHFLVQGAGYSPAKFVLTFPRNYEQAASVLVEAGNDTPLKNLRLEYIQPTGTTGLPAGLKVQLGSPLNLAAKQKGNLTLRISGDNSAAASGLLDYRIVADGLSRPLGQSRIQYSLVEARPMANVTPTQVRTGLAREAEQVESVTLSNDGLDMLRNVRLSLLNEQGGAAPAWVSLRTSERLGDLAVGTRYPIGVAFRPGAEVPEGDYFFTLRIESDNHPLVNIPLQAAVTQSGKGGVIFQVEDIYTGTLNGDTRVLGLKGARIKLQNRKVLSTEYNLTTDEKGQVLLENIPAGEYSYRVSAWDHDDLGGQLWIKPGMTQAETLFLMSKLVTVEWSVKEITLQDRYEVILNATFKTNVPVALVLIEPLSINLPVMRKGDVFQGELTISNYGLIRADEVKARLPSGDARAKIEYLRTVPDTLEAGDVVIVPYRVVALQSFDPDDELNGAAGCWSFNYQGSVSYASRCANGMVVPGSSGVAWSSNGSTGSCGGGGTPRPPSTSLGGGTSSPWVWGGSGGFIARPTPMGGQQQCTPPPDCETCNAKGGGFAGGDGGHGGGNGGGAE